MTPKPNTPVSSSTLSRHAQRKLHDMRASKLKAVSVRPNSDSLGSVVGHRNQVKAYKPTTMASNGIKAPFAAVETKRCSAGKDTNTPKRQDSSDSEDVPSEEEDGKDYVSSSDHDIEIDEASLRAPTASSKGRPCIGLSSRAADVAHLTSSDSEDNGHGPGAHMERPGVGDAAPHPSEDRADVHRSKRANNGLNNGSSISSGAIHRDRLQEIHGVRMVSSSTSTHDWAGPLNTAARVLNYTHALPTVGGGFPATCGGKCDNIAALVQKTINSIPVSHGYAGSHKRRFDEDNGDTRGANRGNECGSNAGSHMVRVNVSCTGGIEDRVESLRRMVADAADLVQESSHTLSQMVKLIDSKLSGHGAEPVRYAGKGLRILRSHADSSLDEYAANPGKKEAGKAKLRTDYCGVERVVIQTNQGDNIGWAYGSDEDKVRNALKKNAVVHAFVEWEKRYSVSHVHGGESQAVGGTVSWIAVGQ
ncbi:hypothetical protein BJ508DRAFT_336872 [Ascobolus immersus RN42]|uniref:Uncharacterized protein n=1 Tax=Ascobolus immersus RN42 TaxID=1160509 RepID=A0A3N4HM28_ASCIM|nr:hypothetical protein BJ508DRAFT_336872 [Ascobolus immersus RN42]